jgi:hypothetical protein
MVSEILKEQPSKISPPEHTNIPSQIRDVIESAAVRLILKAYIQTSSHLRCDVYLVITRHYANFWDVQDNYKNTGPTYATTEKHIGRQTMLTKDLLTSDNRSKIQATPPTLTF